MLACASSQAVAVRASTSYLIATHGIKQIYGDKQQRLDNMYLSQSALTSSYCCMDRHISFPHYISMTRS